VKFNFLVPGDPYHAYYQHKVRRCALRTGAADPPDPRVVPQVAAFKADDAGTSKEPAAVRRAVFTRARTPL